MTAFSEAIFDEGRAFFAALSALPHSYDGPDGLRSEPYGLMAYGEAVSLMRVLRHWVDAPIVVSGTQFIFAGGFDYGDAGLLRLSSELSGATVVALGHGLHEPDWQVPPSVLSPYSYAAYLAYATGHRAALTEAQQLMARLAERLSPDLPTEGNPAKALAWALWGRVPLLLSSRRSAGLPELVQMVFAQVGKSLAVTLGDHPLSVVTGAFEGRHQLGDDAVVLVLDEGDDEVALATEVLSSRVAQVERVAPLLEGLTVPADPVAAAMVYWYISLWVAGYLALLHKLDPADTAVYDAVRQSLLKDDAPLTDVGLN
jgi:hypothetical protein